MEVLKLSKQPSTIPRRLFRALAIIAAPIAFLISVYGANTGVVDAQEYQIKAVFLFNFTQFVEWPPEAFPNEKTPFTIGILGDDPFGTVIDETVQNEVVGHRPIAIGHFRHVEEIGNCQILYISRSETERLEEILVALKNRSILTVSDIDGFSRLGGMIRFVMNKGRIRLTINNGTARSAGLVISSKLLRPSEVISMKGQ